MANSLTIGAVAEHTGSTVPTIRYYEEIGLLPKAARTAAGRRSYGDADVRRLQFIRRCRDFGFPIEQVRELVALQDAGTGDCLGARDLAQQQLDEVRRKMQELTALEASLARLVEVCDATCAADPADGCVILKDLDGKLAASKCC